MEGVRENYELKQFSPRLRCLFIFTGEGGIAYILQHLESNLCKQEEMLAVAKEFYPLAVANEINFISLL